MNFFPHLVTSIHSLSVQARRRLILMRAGRFLIGLLLTLFFITSWTTLGVERFPPPEFEPGYQMPTLTTPSPRANAMDYLDVAVLLATLSAASWAVLKTRSRRRVFGVMIFSLLYFGFYRKGCVCPIGSIQDVALSLFNHGYAVPLTVLIFFLAPLLFTLAFGRSFCAGVCPLGAIQDIFLIKPVKVPGLLSQALGMIPYFYLGTAVLLAATGSAFIICDYDPFVAFFRRTGSLPMLMFGAGMLIIAIFVGRPYCRFLCPYGAILRVLSRFSKWNVTLTPTDCIQCRICEAACPFGAIAEPSAKPAGPRGTWPQLIGSIVLVPVLIALGGWLGGRMAVPLSKIHPAVRLAELVAAEDAAKTVDTSDATRAFRATGRPVAELNTQALEIRRNFVGGSWLLGAFIGFALGLKLAALAWGSAQTTFDPDSANCLACGRCYTYCPKEILRVKQGQKVACEVCAGKT
jgi:NosR/NirI family transcriptional regulator, nitrous oxide reductase regulator